MTALADLFGTPALAGLGTDGDIVDAAEEAELVTRIDATGLTPFEFQGWTGKRLTASFGTRFDFTRGVVEAAPPIPEWLMPLRSRAARFAGLEPGDLNQALVIRYEPGTGIGWHRDRPVYGHVVGVSLGAEATMRFRRRGPKGFERVGVPLEPRSIYHLSGDARHAWEHSIAPMERARSSVTFRSLAARGPTAPAVLGA